jgi:hypothetical protein
MQTLTCLSFKNLRRAAIRLGYALPACREVGPYYYSSNKGNGKRERSPGAVALMVLLEGERLACPHLQEGGILYGQYYPSCSWAGKWPRTKQAIQQEARGVNLFWILADWLVAEAKFPEEVMLSCFS